MGCSPSRGNFGIQGSSKMGRTLLPATQETQSVDGASGGCLTTGDTDGGGGKRRLTGQTHSTQREAPSTPQKQRAAPSEVLPQAVISDKLASQEIQINTLSQGKEKQGDKQDMADKKSGRKPKKNGKDVKQNKKKETEKKASIAEQKVDFPEPLVKAHQAAYTFLNPSIAKYETLLRLLDQATQTQISVQPLVVFMAMRYEGINQGLREIVEEGERLLKENGEHLAWPSQMKNLSSSNPSKSGSIKAEPPPDLLQQLLQYTTQRMRNVGQSVGGIGDSALEEAVEYFTSVSELLEEKLKVKRETEARLMQLLTRIEAASLRKPGPDDSALFSEDSGIGAESESLAGSERRLRSGSCESTGTIRTFPCSPIGGNATRVRQGALRRNFTNKMSSNVSLSSVDSTCTITDKDQKDTYSRLRSHSLDDGEDDDNDDDDGADEDSEGGEQHGRKQSYSLLPDPQQPPCRLPAKRIENPQNVEMTLRMKDAISGRIRFVPSQRASAKTKPTESPKISRQQWTDDEERSPKRPQTAAPLRKALKKTLVTKERRSRSADSLRCKAEDPTLLELERTQKDLSQRMERMSKVKTAGNSKTNPPKQSQGNNVQSPASNRLRPSLEKNNNLPIKDKARLMRSNSGELETGKDMQNDKRKKDKKSTKGPMKATPPNSPPLSRPPSGLYRGRNSVKKLIDTFSQGMEEHKQDSSRVLGPLRGVQKCGVPILPGLGNVELALSTGLTSCRVEFTTSEKNEDLDLDSLPPPPLEVLLDNSFEEARSLLVSDGDDGVSSRGRSRVTKRATTSQRLRASMQSVTVLPSRTNMPQGSRSMSPARYVKKADMSPHMRITQPEVIQADVDPETNETASLYKQAQKIIHLRHSSDSSVDKPFTEVGLVRSNQAGSRGIQDGLKEDVNSPLETEPPTPMFSSRPAATPPVSRARMLPSTPSTPSSLHRRLPSPPIFKRQPIPPSSNSPAVIRKLPTPPPLQWTPPSPPAVRRENYFKAPSPPASPRLQRWIQENSSEDSSSGASFSSRMISNARSVFCRASSSLFEAQPRPPQAWTSPGVSIFPRPWGDRGRFPMSARGPRPFIRRSHSDRRPSLSLPSHSPTISFAETCGSEPALSMKGLEDEPFKEEELWNSQLDLRGTARSASQPDLCIVGQALLRE